MFGGALSWLELSSAIDSGDWDALLARRNRIAWALFRRSPVMTLIRALGEGLLRMGRPVHLAFGHRGYAIALVGPDGAGKSSLARALSQDPEIRAQTIYLGTNPHGGAGRLEPSRLGLSAAEPRTKNGRGLPTRLVRQWRGSVAGWFLKHRGRFVVYDRHPWEGKLAPDRGILARARRAILTFLCPRPDLFVVLEVPPEALHARAPEHSRRRAEDHAARYRRLAQIVPGAVIVDASAPLDETRVRLTRLVWDRYYHHVTGAPLVRS
jgi:thymidylate kinase